MPGPAQNMAELLDRLARTLHAMQFCSGLNPAQWEALRYLARANRYSRNPGGLAEYLGTTKGTASQTVIALESKGYVDRARGPRDRRSVEIRITETGRRMLEADPLTRISEVAESLPSAERDAVVETLGRIVTTLHTERQNCTFGLCDDCRHLCDENAACPSDGKHCGLTGEFLSVEERQEICVNFESRP